MNASRSSQSLIWHQFLKETREHRHGLVIVLLCAFGYTIAAASGALEAIQTLWAYPLLTKYPRLPFLLTLLPGLFIVPFLAFADPCNEEDAFWITKPLQAITIAGAKIAFILIWLVGVPLLGEIVVVMARGGTTQLGPVIFDFILIRAAFYFTTLAFASLFGEPLKFTIAILCAPLGVAVLLSVVQSVWPEESSPITTDPLVVSSLIVWSIGLSIIGLVTATIQYHVRTGRTVALLFAIAGLAVVTLVSQNSDLLTRPVQRDSERAEEISGISVQMSSPTLVPTPLTAQGRPGDRFDANITISNLPPFYALNLRRIRLTLTTSAGEVSFNQFGGDPRLFYETRPAPLRIFEQMLSHLKEMPLVTTTVPAHLSVTLPQKLRALNWKGQEVSVVGNLTFDVFHHNEFGRMDRSNLGNDEPSITRGGTSITMHGLFESRARSLVTFINRHFAATCGQANHELHSDWTPHILPWYFMPKNRQSDTYFEQFDQFHNERCRGPAFGALHISRSTMLIPPSQNFDEVIVFQSRYLGSIERSITLNRTVLNNGE